MELNSDADLTFGVYQIQLRLNKHPSSIVIVLAGIGSDFSKAPEFDFQGVGASFTNHSFIYVRDNSRSWYTSSNGWIGLVYFLQECITGNSSKVILLGSSMGGAGVLRLAKYIKADRVVAISPRSTLNADFDIRNAEIVEAVENPELLNYFPAAIGSEYIVLFSIDDYEDTLHVARLPFTSYWVRGGHNIAYTFKKLDLLDVFFEALCVDPSLLESLGFYRSTASTFNSALQRNNDIFERSECDENVIPEYLFDSWYQKELIKCAIGKSNGHPFFPVHYLSRVAGSELDRYLFYGWSHLEEWGIWGIGPVHTFGFRLFGNSSQLNVYVNISFAVFKPSPDYDQQVIVLLNGSCVFNGYLKDNRCLLTFPAAEKENSVVIITKNHISPDNCEMGSDTRSLSVGIEEIFFKPMFRLK